jgi:hypothetical protein
MSCERALRLGDGLCSLLRVPEDHEELVTAMVHDVPAAALDRRAQELAMVGEDEGITVAELAHELRRALDVCEDECDRSIGEIRGQSLLQWDLGTDACSCAWWTVDH